MSSPPVSPAAPHTPAEQPILPDDILEEIFLRLDGAADLARLYAACSTFRRLVSGRRFLRRFRSLHPPPILGFIDYFRRICLDGAGVFQPAQPPHGSAKAARALAQAADFNFGFLPGPGSWHVRDARDGRVLVSRRTDMRCTTEVHIGFIAEELVVCDPLHRRFVQIPSIPGDLAASAGYCGTEDFKPFFDPIREDEEEESSIRVICIVQSKTKVGTFVFSSVTGNWGYPTSFGIEAYECLRLPKLMRRHYAHGCFYLADFYWKHMLVLDTQQMEFSVIDLPPEIKGEYKTIVELREDRLGFVVLADRVLHVYVKTLQLQADGVGANDWRHDRAIALPNFYWTMTGAVKGYVLLRGILRDYTELWNFFDNKPNAYYFTLDLKTFLIERLCMLEFNTLPDHLYASFPPPLSPASI